MALIKVLLIILVLSLAVGSGLSAVCFCVDTRKWHDKEEQTIIEPSNSPNSEMAADTSTYAKCTIQSNIESEVIDNGEHEHESDSSAFPFSWGKS